MNFALYMKCSPFIGWNDKWIYSIASNNGWTANQSEDGSYFLEPINCPIGAVGSSLFHVTNIQNINPILLNGLKKGSGGTTWMKRGYTPRIYFATSLVDAFLFLDSKALGRAPIGGPGNLEAADLQSWEIIAIAAELPEYPIDAWMMTAVWIEKDIPPEKLRVVLGWREAYLSLSKIRDI